MKVRTNGYLEATLDIGKRFLKLAIIISVLIASLRTVFWIRAQKYTSWPPATTESQVTARLGKPQWDSRVPPVAAAESGDFELGYYGDVGEQFKIEFKNGVVVRGYLYGVK